MKDMQMSVVIYGVLGSRASRCLWTAEELGIAYRWEKISHRDGTSRTPAYLAISPGGKIPGLSDGDVRMTESMAINHYLASTYGQGTLWPEDAASQAKILQWSFWSATEIEYYIGALFVEMLVKQPPERDQGKVDRLIGEMLPKFADLERALEGRDYLLGAFSLADIQVAIQTITIMGLFGVDFADYPQVRGWTERCAARPARVRAMAL